jgi:undecaprenyl-phosphate galactose phosphotransferase
MDHATVPSRQHVSATSARDLSVASHIRARICQAGLVTSDLVAFVLATFLAFALSVSPELSPYARALTNARLLGIAWHGWGTMLVLVGLLAYLGGHGHYSSRVPSWTQAGDLVLATLIALACDTFLTVAIYGSPLQPESMIRWLLLCPSILVCRSIARHALSAAGVWQLRTLIVAPRGELEAARSALLSDPALGYTVVGTVDPNTAANLSDTELLAFVADHRADFVVIASRGHGNGSERTFLSTLRSTGLPVALVPSFQGMPVVGFRQHYFLGHDIVLLVNRDNLSRPLNRLLKHAFDQIGAAILIVFMAPLLATIAVLVRSDGGPVFFRHGRIGAGGREFGCMKFRTMVTDADVVLRRLLDTDPRAAAEWRATQKLRNDPRVTRVGRFLRRSSLDELPQLFNVLRGDMSLVGPRPIVRDEVRRYGRNIEYYYAAKPGMTGLWQVGGRSETGYEQRVGLDVWYVRNWTPWHDIAILLRTIPAVFLQRGAF